MKYSFKYIISAMLLSLLLFSSRSTAQSVDGHKYINLIEYTLDNGLHVIMHRDTTSPIVNVGVMYHVGGKNERPGKTGFAHLVEHVMFHGTKNIAQGEFEQMIRYAGGYSNASTSSDRTYYYMTLPSNQLKTGLWISGEQMMHPVVTTQGLKREVEVVKEEMRIRYMRSPLGMVEMDMMEMEFAKHPYKWPLVGTEEDLNSATVDDINEFVASFYIPNNAVLSIAGDFEPAAAKQWVKEYFANIPSGAPFKRPVYDKKAEDSIKYKNSGKKEERIINTSLAGIKSPHMILSYMATPEDNRDTEILKFLIFLINDDKEGELNTIKNDTTLGISKISISPEFYEQAGMVWMRASFKDISKGSAILDKIENVFQNIAKKGINNNRIARLKKSYESDYADLFFYPASIGEMASYDYLTKGNSNKFLDIVSTIYSITNEDIKRVAAEYLTKSNRSAIIYNIDNSEKGQKNGSNQKNTLEGGARYTPNMDIVKCRAEQLEKAYQNDKVDRTITPKAQEPKPIKIGEAKTFSAANGSTLFIVRKRDYPKFRVSMSYKVPSLYDEEEMAKREILSNIYSNLLQEESYKKQSDELTLEGVSCNPMLMTYSGSGMLQDLDKFFKAIAPFVNNSFITKERFIKAKEEYYNSRKEAIERETSGKENRYESKEMIFKLKDSLDFYPNNNIKQPKKTTLEEIEAVKLNDVKGYFNRYMNPQNTFCMITGDITKETIDKLFKRYLGSWKKGEKYHDPKDESEKAFNFPTKRKIFIIDKPEMVQSQISVEWPLGDAFPYGENEALLKVMNQIFGESYSSYLNSNLRLDKGLCYGAKCFLTINAVGGTCTAATNVRTDQTAYALENIIYEMLRMRNQLVDEKTLDMAKNGLIGDYARSMSILNSPSLLGFGMVKEEYQLPDDYLENYPAKIYKVTAKEVREAAQKYIKPYECIIYITGDAKALKGKLEKFGEVEYK